MRDCRVNRLHLKSSDPAATRHTALLVEDGLRTASFPDDGGRLIIVRSLALGRIARSASALTVSMQIEQALQRQRTQIVHAASAEAAHAQAVFFRDEGEALLTFALQLARGITPTAWFWQRVIPGWQPRQSHKDGFRLLLRVTITDAAGSVLLLRLVRGMVNAGKEDALLNVLQSQDGVILLRQCGWQLPRTVAENHFFSPPRQVSSSAILRHWVANWGTEDARTIWLANMLIAIKQPLRMDDPHLSEQSLQWIATVAALGNELAAAPPTAFAPELTDSDRDVNSKTHPKQQRERHLAKQPLGSQRALPTSDFEQNRSPSDSLPLKARAVDNEGEPAVFEQSMEDATWSDVLEVTRAGGLFFLLNLLNRLHFGEWLIAHPQWLTVDLPQYLLAVLCRQLSVAEDDPIWQLLRADAPAEIEGELRDAINDWLMRLQEWCTAFADLDLGTIVLRPARMQRSETHIDLYFDLSQVDLRIRRVGLDFDPGWVAWLGQVVMFHYV